MSIDLPFPSLFSFSRVLVLLSSLGWMTKILRPESRALVSQSGIERPEGVASIERPGDSISVILDIFSPANGSTECRWFLNPPFKTLEKSLKE